MTPWIQTNRDRLLVIGLFLALNLLFLSACGSQAATSMEAATPSSPISSAAPESTNAPAADGGGTTAEDFANVIASRTPEPTRTPGVFDQRIEDFAEAAGLTETTFLGLTIDDWINIGVSVLIVIFGYFAGAQLVAKLPKWINRHTSLNLSTHVLKDLGANLKWLVLLIFIRYAIMRLAFLSDEFRTFFDDVIFVLGLVIITMTVLKLVNSTVQQYKDSLAPNVDRERLTPVLMMAQRFGDLLVLIIAVSFGSCVWHN